MKALRRTVTILALLACVAGTADHAAAERPAKTGIVLVAFGTTVPEARAAYDAIERRVVDSFPDTPVRWAYTSAAVRGKVARRGQALDSLETALARMMDEGFTHVAVQSLHVIAGWEFLEVQRNAAAFGAMTGGFARVTVGAPLLGSAADLPRVAAALLKMAADRAPGEAVVFMGHGTTHASNAGYAALMYHLQRRDPAVFMGTAGQDPGIEEVRDLMRARGLSAARLVPFMAVAGEHARSDLAGDGPTSWKSILTAAGVRCTPVLTGAAEVDELATVWVDHLKEAVAQLAAAR